MAKASGSMRGSASVASRAATSSVAPRAAGTEAPWLDKEGSAVLSRLVSERTARLAEQYGDAAGIDPEDLAYSTVADSPSHMIERAIEANTDYDVVGHTATTINLINRNGDESEYLNNDPVHEYDAGRKNLVEIIRELRDKSERNLFRKDFKY